MLALIAVAALSWGLAIGVVVAAVRFNRRTAKDDDWEQGRTL